MQNRRWLGVMAVGLVLVVALGGGCKKKKTMGSGMGDDNIGGIMGSGMMDGEGGGLAGRPDGVTEMAGQFVPVYFDYDSSQVNDAERSKCEMVAEYLRSNAAVGVIVEGHCDERGSSEYNLALGERRALAVRAFLVGLGVDGARIQTKSFGEEKPVCFEHDDSCWSKNRRGEFVLFQ
ncbi:MAG: peptidoglycan-associated lipoprotein [Lentisphaerae bacterium GWF2_57_35]|nr:MAG: peptidoglycan-associated lipoprotein [Lentisphaerae bacterium GWF2_57_35]